MDTLNSQISKTLVRWQEREKNRNRNLRLINEKRFFTIDSPARVRKFLARRGISQLDAEGIVSTAKGVPSLVEPVTSQGETLSLERIMGTNDLVSVAFLETGLVKAKTVGRMWICGNSGNLLGYGTGFLISPSLLLTNHHVLPDFDTAKYAKVEFNYQLDTSNNLLPSEMFQLDPASFYFSDESLDFALVAVMLENTNRKLLAELGWNMLSPEEGKTIISQWLNIIQHPNGLPKQIGLRENQLIDVLDDHLHYRTDTAPGSSGAPVYNERWEVVALHHAGVEAKDASQKTLSVTGGIWNPNMGEDQIKWIANEGVRISSILKKLSSLTFNTAQTKLLNEIFISDDSGTSNNMRTTMENKSNKPASSINEDGSITFTVPLSVTFKLGDAGVSAPPVVNVQLPAAAASNEPAPTAGNSETSESAILGKAKKEFLQRRDVLGVRMGYVFRNGWITNERGLVITVSGRKTIHELKKEGSSPLPEKFMEYPVEVTGPTFEEIIALHKGGGSLEALFNPTSVTPEEIKYVPPDNVKLRKIKDTMRVIAHVSPEQGWENLQAFLSKTKQTLTVAMYDFGAKHILKVIEDASTKSSFKDMTMAIQPRESLGEGTKANDITDEAVVQDLQDTLGSKFHNAWVKIGRVNGWVSSSYHIKVAVRDSSSIWLSSGNWQSSNQPNIPELEDQSQSFLLKNYNREWHAIVEHDGIAQAYETFIKNDYEHNDDGNGGEEALNVDNLNFLVPRFDDDYAEEAAKEYISFPPFEEEREFTVTPLLTPDNFYDEVTDLVNSAKHELLIQNQTFNAPKEGHDKLEALVNTVLKKQKSGVDVKIIFRVLNPSDARKNLEALVDMGFNSKSIKLQKNCHTKGVIVDGKRVMLGSQNWSNDGVSVNRDASLLFDDEPLAKYFRQIFCHDWDNLAHYSIGKEKSSMELADDPHHIPDGMELLTWSDVRETL